MCIIAIKPQKAEMFPESTIRTMFENNPDGAGYMFYDKSKKQVCWKKGFMSVDALLKDLNTRDFSDTPLILHFRIGTSGKKTKLCCHPYPIYDRNKVTGWTDLAVCHNGVLNQYYPGAGSAINDSQNFIKKVLSKLKKGFLDDPDKTLLIQELLGTSKLAFLDDKGTVYLMGDFVHEGEYVYSNHSFNPRPTYQSTLFSWKTPKDWEVEDDLIDLDADDFGYNYDFGEV